MVKYTLIERPNRDLLVGATIRVLGSTGKEEDIDGYGESLKPLATRSISEQVRALMDVEALGWKLNKKKEEDMSSNFENLKTVFDLKYEDAEEFWLDLARAAEGIRQHDALHRIDDAFGLNLAAVLLVGDPSDNDNPKTDKVTTIIGDNNEGEQ